MADQLVGCTQMLRTARVILILAALVLLYCMNATVAWGVLLIMFVCVMTKRRRSCVSLPVRPRPASEEG
jgi:hypothetical protein